jgi:integrase
MPSKPLTDAFIENLTFAKALRDAHKAAMDRWEAAMDRWEKVCKKAEAGEPPPPKPTKAKPIKADFADWTQVTYVDTRERGLAVTLVVSYGGTKAFRVMTYRNGKPHSVKLGTYPQMSVKDAWAKAREYFANPQQFAAKAGTGTFKDVAEQWIRRHVDENKLRSKDEIERCLKVYVYPKWGSRKFLEIRRPEVNELLDGIVDNHGRSQADAVLAIVRGICNWYAANRSEHYVSPIVAKMKRDRRKPKDRARSRFLADDEIRAVWRAAGLQGMFGAFVKIALLTGQRREKIATMKWDDIRDGVWTIASEEREKGTAGKLKLPQLALDIIEAQPRIAENPHVFAGRGKTAFNSFSQRKSELDEKLPPMPAWTLHDLRRTCRKLMTRARIRPDVAELALGHSIKGIQAVYDDPQEYQPLIDAGLQSVANEVERIINPPADNVVDMTSSRRSRRTSPRP